jgi:hypothetical protein
MRVVSPLVVVALVASALAALPSQAGTAGLPPLTATTVVTARSSGYVDVQLSRDARLSPRYLANPDVAFVGAGRLLGMWLRPLASHSQDTLEVLRPPAFLDRRTRTSGSTEPAPTCSDELGGQSCTSPTPTAILLHAGKYRMTVLTDGHPVRITLRLKGLSEGRTALTPSHVLASAESALPARESIGDTTVTYGATGPLTGNLLTFVAAVAEGKGSEVDGWSLCERRDAAGPPPFGYSAVCPGSTSGGYALKAHQGSYGVFGVWVTAGADDTTPVGLGGSFTNDGGVVLQHTLGVWMRMP